MVCDGFPIRVESLWIWKHLRIVHDLKKYNCIYTIAKVINYVRQSKFTLLRLPKTLEPLGMT